MRKLTFSNADTREVFANKDYADFHKLMFDTASKLLKRLFLIYLFPVGVKTHSSTNL